MIELSVKTGLGAEDTIISPEFYVTSLIAGAPQSV